MKIKEQTLLLSLLLSGIPQLLPAQYSLKSELNVPRAGDVIIKQQVEYKDPGRSGENVLWDFGELKSVNDKYTLSYSEPDAIGDSVYIMGKDTVLLKNLDGGRLLIGTEHHTMYYYYLTHNRLWALGHENPTTLLQYTQPLIAGMYPMQYQDSCRYAYQSKGLYSSTVPFTSDGEAQIRADACGMMILPSGDTLRNVLLTRTLQSIRQVFPTGDSTTVEHNSSMETCKWYSKGCRYPVFETIRTLIKTDTAEIVNFETAFFFPPEEHSYLEDDPENTALLEENPDSISDPWAELTYNFYPNPVKTNLEIEVYMPRQGEVKMQLTDRLGRIVWKKDFGKWNEGAHSAQIFMSPFVNGEYVLNMWFDEYMTGEKILKR